MRVILVTLSIFFLTLPTAFLSGRRISPSKITESTIEQISEKKRQVANYSVGKYGTQSYEHFSFWVEGEERGEITYSHGKDAREVKLTFLGMDTFKGTRCFKVRFANGLVLYVIPKGVALKVVDGDRKYSKIFRWEYEGPVDGRGTFCEPCVGEDKEAITFIKKYFVK